MRRTLAGMVVASIALLVATASAGADPGSLPPAPKYGPRPGPAILYAPPARAPQLENTGVWKADPILVSGASAYRAGEFLYQDFLYDDQGAGTPPPAQDSAPLAPTGQYTYPTDPRYAGNAADLVEVRLRPLAAATAIRLTYNSMHDPSLVATTIGLGDSATPMVMPHGANAREPAKVFVTVHGGVADVVDAATGVPIPGVTPSVSVDLARRQVEVDVPYAAFDPRGQTAVRVAAAAGLWDQANDAYLMPQASADATHPGGAGPSPSEAAFFNVAFRYAEAATSANPWRNDDQTNALRNGDLSAFSASVDFTKLAAGVNDDMPDQPTGVPQRGFVDRILASHFESAQGRGSASSLIPEDCPQECIPDFAGQLQPYEIYIPTKSGPNGYGMTLDWHYGLFDYNSHLGNPRQVQLGERGTGSIVYTGEARGPTYWYYGQAAADGFEIWADIARRYKLDPDWTAMTGISMSGYGTFKFASLFPDLFSAIALTVPCPSAGAFYTPGRPAPGGEATAAIHVIPSLRNIPEYSWQTPTDEFCSYEGPEGQTGIEQAFDDLGYRYDFFTFTPTDHHALSLTSNQHSEDFTTFLGTRRVDRNPPHVTYVIDQEMREDRFGIDPDHAYWLSSLALRDKGGTLPLGTIDAFSHGFGVGDPPALPTERSAGTYTGGVVPALAFTEQRKRWGAAPAAPVADRLDITASNVRTATVDVARARVDCRVALSVHSDGPIDITLAGCKGAAAVRRFPGRAGSVCSSRRAFWVTPRVRGRVLRRVVTVAGRRVHPAVSRRRDGRPRVRIDLRGLHPATVRVVVTSRVRRSGRTRTSRDRRTYHTCAKKRIRKPARHRATKKR